MSAYKWGSLARKAFELSKEADGEVVGLADWLELQALERPSRSCSRITLEGALTTEEWSPPGSGMAVDQADAKEWADRAMAELRWREQWFGKTNYPFRVADEGRTIEFTGEPGPFSIYLVLLAISYINPKKTARTPAKDCGAFLLEGLSWLGISGWLGTHESSFGQKIAFVHHLGKPSLTKLSKAFHKSIDELAAVMRDGEGYQMPAHGRPQVSGDDGVDILAWRGFPDDLGGQFLLFTGCAAGLNFSGDKRREVDPETWVRTNFRKGMRTKNSWAKCYVVPRQLAVTSHHEISLSSGVILDRCRLSYITQSVDHEITKRAVKWLEKIVDCSHLKRQVQAAAA